MGFNAFTFLPSLTKLIVDILGGSALENRVIRRWNSLFFVPKYYCFYY